MHTDCIIRVSLSPMDACSALKQVRATSSRRASATKAPSGQGWRNTDHQGDVRPPPAQRQPGAPRPRGLF